MNKLLLDESPLMVLPGLAKAIGLEEAVVLQQIHWLLGRSKNERDGRLWVYNSYPAWNRDHFPWMVERSMRRVFDKLREMGLLIATADHNDNRSNRTLWYTIDYEKVEALTETAVHLDKMATSTSGQNGHMVIQENTIQENTIHFPPSATEDVSPVVNDLRSMFEKFWKHYKVTGGTSKQKAWESWQRINPDEDLFREIGIALAFYNSYWEASGTEDKYVPHPVTWLNQKKWENPPTQDQITQAKKKNAGNIKVTNSGAKRKLVM